ncbi:MAG: hypothetical protein KKB39_06380 [Nanoarchaeota archaeon]|nr:hypothetical protein [Nanoarchaeota archaeon]
MDRSFEIKFRIINHNIQTEIKQKNISPQEAIGLLEMAKSQILENLAKGRQEIFSGMKKGE